MKVTHRSSGDRLYLVLSSWPAASNISSRKEQQSPRIRSNGLVARRVNQGIGGARRSQIRSRMGSSAANWSRAPAAFPASPVKRARLPGWSGCPGAQGPGPAP